MRNPTFAKRVTSLLAAVALMTAINGFAVEATLPPIPDTPPPLAEDSVPLGDSKSFTEVKLDLPVAPGSFAPTWESIEKNYPGEPAWLREATCPGAMPFATSVVFLIE